MATKQQIEQFLSSEPIAMAGVSRNPKKFGRIAYDELTRKGLKLIPINPNLESINGTTCYTDIQHLPDGVQSLVIMTKKDKTAGMVEAALAKGIKNIWIQQASDTPEALALLKGKDVNLITKQCILMHHKPDGFHKFHRNIKRFFGGLPK
ncbi:MAG: CoA-binding protein [Bacteroidia bacterium]|nr:CoA-binding protein [Bacteroidia bacterium]